ncbi:MAG: hypothetical protein NTV57_05650 [Cyanobacteria bacterium]|nr:hypothetical protein [Cyanobacteriota bacterium]
MSQTSDPSLKISGQARSGTLRAADSPLQALQTLANELEGQPELLLELLRRIEQLHRTIQDGPFRSSLPSDRNALFRLLSEMEHSGGWPYIPRLQLRTFIDLLSNELLSHDATTQPVPETETVTAP